MPLRPIKTKRTWERLNNNLNRILAAGSSLCWDVYNETGSTEAYSHPGPGQSSAVVLDIYDAKGDAWLTSKVGSGAITNMGGDYPGIATAWTSLSQCNGSASIQCLDGTTTTIITPVTLTKSIVGTTIRIIGGPNAGYEGTVVANTTGPNSILTIYPECSYINKFSVIELYAGSVYFLYMGSGGSTTPFLQVFDIASSSWFTRATGNVNIHINTSIKLTSLPQINSTLDTAIVTAVKTNWLPSGNCLSTPAGWNVRAGTTVDQLGVYAPQPPARHSQEPSNYIKYTSGDGYVWKTGYRIKSNTTYTYSIWIQAPTSTNIQMSIYLGAGVSHNTLITPTTSWVRYNYTFTTAQSPASYNEVGFYVQADCYVYGLQLEESNSVTDYLNSTYYERYGVTNLLPYSSTPASWAVNNGATVTTGQTDPFGGTSAALLTDGASGNPTVIFGGIAKNWLNKQLTMSIWLKAGTATTAFIAMEQSASPYTSMNTNVTIDSTWKKYSFTNISSVSVVSFLGFIRVGTNGVGGEGTLYAAFPQIEYGSVSNDYVNTSSSTEVKAQTRTGDIVTKLTLNSKNYLPGSLINSRIRYTVPSYHNLLAFSDDFSNNSIWTTMGGATKTGNTLNTPIDNARCDVRPNILNSHTFPGPTTFTLVASGSGTFSIYAYDAVLASSSNAQVFTLSSTPQKFTYTYNFTAPFSFPVFGRSAGNTTTAITVHHGQLEYKDTASDLYVPNTGSLTTIGYLGGTRYARILDNDENSITIAGSIGNIPNVDTELVIEPNGDDIYLSGNTDNALYVFNQRSNSWLPSEVIPTQVRASLPGWEHSACFIDKIDGWSLPQSVPLRTPSTAYTYGNKIRHSGYSYIYDYNKAAVLECTTPGTSSVSSLSGWQFVNSLEYTTTDGTAVFTNRFTEQPGRYIYSFRGNSSGILQIFDIATSKWYSCDISINYKYGGCTTQFTTGTTYAQDGRYIYICKPYAYNRSDFYRFDIKRNILEPWVYLKEGSHNGGVNSASRIWISRIKIGNELVTFVNFHAISRSDVFRCREIV